MTNHENGLPPEAAANKTIPAAQTAGQLAAGETVINPFNGLLDESELNVLGRLANGKKVLHVQRELGFSGSDVDRIVQNLHVKFEVPRRDGLRGKLVYTGLANGLVPFERLAVAPAEILDNTEITLLTLFGQGHTVQAVANQVNMNNRVVQTKRIEAAAKLTGKRQVPSYPMLAFEAGILELKPLEERLSAAERMKQVITDKRSAIANVRPITIDELTTEFREEVRNGQVFKIRHLMTPAEYRARQIDQASNGGIDRSTGSHFDDERFDFDDIPELNG